MSTDKARRGRPKGSGLDDRMLLEAIRGLIAGDPALKPTTAIKMVGVTDPSVIRRLRDKLKSTGPDPEVVPTRLFTPRRESLDSVTALPQSIGAARDTGDLPGSLTATLPRARPIPPGSEPKRQRALRVVEKATIQSVAAKVEAGASPVLRQEHVADGATVSVARETRTAGQNEPGVRSGAPDQRRAEAAGTTDTLGTAKPVSSARKSQSHADEVTTLLVRWYALGMTAVFSTAEAQVKVMESMLKAPPVALAVRQQLMALELAKALLPGGGKKPKRRS